MGYEALLLELLLRIDPQRDWTDAMKPSSGFLRVYKHTQGTEGMPVRVHFDAGIATVIATIPCEGYCASKHQGMQFKA
jgi:hypothetical protein